MTLFHATVESECERGVLLRVRFGTPAGNDALVPAAREAIDGLQLAGGRLLLVDGPMSLPVAFVIAHSVAHRFGAVAVNDPKLGRFVVAISHSPDYRLGDLLDPAEVVEECDPR